jgi:hypothetical protein
MSEATRQIRFYEKHGDKYIGEIPIKNVQFKDLLNLIDAKEYKDDPVLYDCYFLDKSKLDKLSAFANQAFALDLDKYDYFLEATGT